MPNRITCAALRKESDTAHELLDSVEIAPGPLPDRIVALIERVPPSWDAINDLLKQIQELSLDAAAHDDTDA